MSTQDEIRTTYDLPVEFYRLWLDAGMNYSCALFDGTDDLDLAQAHKLRWMSEAAGVTPDTRVLDVGCGWGGALEYLAVELGVKAATGITLSPTQYGEVQRRCLPGVSVECVDYRGWSPPWRFDSVISIGMFEHIATPEQARTGQHIDLYRRFFRLLWEWTAPGARFGLQTVIGEHIPRNREHLRELGWATYTVFPGAITPRLEALAASVGPYWEILEIRTRREDYAKTTAEWRRRLRANEAIIRSRWGDDCFTAYDRYLKACVMAFELGYQSLVQCALRRNH